MPNDIGTKQNSPEALALLRGVRRAYGKAKLLGKKQLGLSISVVVASPLAAHFAPEAKAYVALYGAFILLIDLLFLEPAAKKNHEAGAKIQELFDERVLAFPWRGRHPPERLTIVSIRGHRGELTPEVGRSRPHGSWILAVGTSGIRRDGPRRRAPDAAIGADGGSGRATAIG